MAITRKAFLKKSGLLAAAGCCGGMMVLLPGCAGFKTIDGTLEAGKLAIPKSSWEEGKALVIKNNKLPAPVYLSGNGKAFTAVLMLCTHKNCELFVSGDVLECPCHGSEFSISGEVLSPPAREDLQSLPVTTDDTHIYINI